MIWQPERGRAEPFGHVMPRALGWHLTHTHTHTHECNNLGNAPPWGDRTPAPLVHTTLALAVSLQGYTVATPPSSRLWVTMPQAPPARPPWLSSILNQSTNLLSSFLFLVTLDGRSAPREKAHRCAPTRKGRTPDEEGVLRRRFSAQMTSEGQQRTGGTRATAGSTLGGRRARAVSSAPSPSWSSS